MRANGWLAGGQDPAGFTEYIAEKRSEHERRYSEKARCMASPLNVSYQVRVTVRRNGPGHSFWPTWRRTPHTSPHSTHLTAWYVTDWR